MIRISLPLAKTIWRNTEDELYQLHDDGTESLVEGMETLDDSATYGIEGEIFGAPYEELNG